MRWIFLVLGVMACKPDAETCQKACLNFAKLAHFENLAEELKTLSVDDQNKLRERRDREWELIKERKDDRGRENCKTRCRTDSRRADAECMAIAKTAKAARACVGQ